MSIKAKVVVIGSGPGGYTAAFRAADLLGEGVVLVERYEQLGGVCLNVGCIPSKALLHMAAMIDEAPDLAKHGVDFGKPKLDFDKILNYKQSVVKKLNMGLAGLAKKRKVKVITGEAKFVSDKQLVVDGKDKTTIDFEHCIIAAGSRPVELPFLPDDPRIFSSTGALELRARAGRMLIIGGGIIGMEMACVYNSFGLDVNVVELSPGILGNVDKDLAMPLLKRAKAKYESVRLETKVTKVEATKEGLMVTFEGKEGSDKPERFDWILSAVGRVPNGKLIDADKAGVNVDERGFIATDKQMRTNVPHIFAIGDIVGNPMLAHKAIPEARVAAEVIAGKKHFFDPKCIPSVAYTDPEVAWVGLTESDAKEQGIEYGKGQFPWAASGRAIGMGREEGFTKVLFDKKTNQVLGAGITGVHAGDLINEVALAIEMGCEAEDLALTIHAHPTLAETIPLAAEVYEGTVTDL
ncbi:MAG: dihydrolipoyl dehydrogenase [Legionellales bacterium]|nr:dihydrolipoyl dehydrogenase [Legionellales bacterium]